MKHRNIANVATAILAMTTAHVGAYTDSCEPRKRTMQARKQCWLLGLAMLVMSGSVSGTEYPITVDEGYYYKVVLTDPKVAVITLAANIPLQDVCPPCYLLIMQGEYVGNYVVLSDERFNDNVFRTEVFRSGQNNDSVTTVSLDYDTVYWVYMAHRGNSHIEGDERIIAANMAIFRTHANPNSPEPPEPPEPPCPEWQEAAFIPVMMASRAEGRDNKLWIANRGDNSVRVRITGWDQNGREYSGFEREIPAKRPTKVLMREIEDAIGNGEGHWSLTIESTGTVHVVALAISAEAPAHNTLPVVLPMKECTE